MEDTESSRRKCASLEALLEKERSMHQVTRRALQIERQRTFPKDLVEQITRVSREEESQVFRALATNRLWIVHPGPPIRHIVTLELDTGKDPVTSFEDQDGRTDFNLLLYGDSLAKPSTILEMLEGSDLWVEGKKNIVGLKLDEDQRIEVENPSDRYLLFRLSFNGGRLKLTFSSTVYFSEGRVTDFTGWRSWEFLVQNLKRNNIIEFEISLLTIGHDCYQRLPQANVDDCHYSLWAQRLWKIGGSSLFGSYHNNPEIIRMCVDQLKNVHQVDCSNVLIWLRDLKDEIHPGPFGSRPTRPSRPFMRFIDTARRRLAAMTPEEIASLFYMAEPEPHPWCPCSFLAAKPAATQVRR